MNWRCSNYTYINICVIPNNAKKMSPFLIEFTEVNSDIAPVQNMVLEMFCIFLYVLPWDILNYTND